MEADEDGDGEVDIAEFQSVMARKALEAADEMQQDAATVQIVLPKFNLERANRATRHKHEEMMNTISNGQAFGLAQVYRKEDTDEPVRAITTCIGSIDCCNCWAGIVKVHHLEWDSMRVQSRQRSVSILCQIFNSLLNHSFGPPRIRGCCNYHKVPGQELASKGSWART